MPSICATRGAQRERLGGRPASAIRACQSVQSGHPVITRAAARGRRAPGGTPKPPESRLPPHALGLRGRSHLTPFVLLLVEPPAPACHTPDLPAQLIALGAEVLVGRTPCPEGRVPGHLGAGHLQAQAELITGPLTKDNRLSLLQGDTHLPPVRPDDTGWSLSRLLHGGAATKHRHVISIHEDVGA